MHIDLVSKANTSAQTSNDKYESYHLERDVDVEPRRVKAFGVASK